MEPTQHGRNIGIYVRYVENGRTEKNRSPESLVIGVGEE